MPNGISDMSVVLHLGRQKKENTFVFEEISNKLNFHPCRLANLCELLSYLSSSPRPPTIISLQDSILKDLSTDSNDQEEINFSAIISAINLIIRARFETNSTKIAVLVEDPVTREKIKSWKSAGVDGLLPMAPDFSFHVSLKAYQDLLDSGASWPTEVIEKTHHRRTEIKNVVCEDGIELTDRQAQVRDLLCERGLSNKAIARQLNISESTVKIHVGSILKRYGVRNRTQLALAVNNGARL